MTGEQRYDHWTRIEESAATIRFDRSLDLPVVVNDLCRALLDLRREVGSAREPIPEPGSPLPTEVGSLIRATSTNGETCEVMARSVEGEWWGVSQDGFARYWDPNQIVEWEPVRVVLDEGGDAS